MKKGFTLIEFMIVLAIIAILALIAVPPMYKRLSEHSRSQAAQSLLKQIGQAEQALQQFSQAEDDPAAGQGGHVDSAVPENIATLASFGFQPATDVAFYIDVDAVGGGFVAFAGHVDAGSPVFVCDNDNCTGDGGAVVPWDSNYIAPKGFTLPAGADAFKIYTYNDAAKTAALERTCAFTALSAVAPARIEACAAAAPAGP